MTIRTPGHDDDLIRGLLFIQCRIVGAHEISCIQYASERPQAALTVPIVLGQSLTRNAPLLNFVRKE